MIQTITPSLLQGINYISKKGFKSKKKSKLRKEGFTNQSITEMVDQGFNPLEITNVQNNINNKYQSIDELYDDYDHTNEQLVDNENKVLSQIRNAMDRKTTKNSYLNQNIQMNGDINNSGYVTNQGIFKKYRNIELIWAKGHNGVPTGVADVTTTNEAPIDPGAELYINNNPSLLVGQPMNLGQSVGHEGQNVYVNEMISDTSNSYNGCGLSYPQQPVRNNMTKGYSDYTGSNTGASSAKSGHSSNEAFDNNITTYWESLSGYDPNTGYSLSPFFNIEIFNNDPNLKWDWNGFSSVNTINGEYLIYAYSTPQILYSYNINLTGRIKSQAIPVNAPTSWWVIGKDLSRPPYYRYGVLDRQENQQPTNISQNLYPIKNIQNQAYNNFYLIIDKIYIDPNDAESYRNSASVTELTFYTSQLLDSSRYDNFINSGLGNVTVEQCKQYSIDNGYKFYSMRNKLEDDTAQCFVSNDARSYGNGETYLEVIPIMKFNMYTLAYDRIVLYSGLILGYYKESGKNYIGLTTVIGDIMLFISCFITQGYPFVDVTNNQLYNISAYYGTNCMQGGDKNVINAVKEQILSQINTDKQLLESQNINTNDNYFDIPLADALNIAKKSYYSINVNNDDLTDTAVGCPKNFTLNYTCGLQPKTVSYDMGEGQVAVMDCTEEVKACKVYLIMQDDGNLCMYKGDEPTDEVQSSLWCSWTNGKQGVPNPDWKKENGKNGRSYLLVGESLNRGEWIGNSNGTMRLLLDFDGLLVLQISNIKNLCTKNNVNINFGSGLVNAIYSIIPGIKSFLGKMAYVDADSVAHEYTPDQLQGQNTYAVYSGYDSVGNDFAVYNVNNLSECEQECSKTDQCRAFVYTSNTCYLKNENAYPKSARQFNSSTTLGVRNIEPINQTMNRLPTNNVDTLFYGNYEKGDTMTEDILNQNNINVNSQQLGELSGLNTQLNDLGSQITEKQGELFKENTIANNAMNGASNTLNNSMDQYNKMLHAAQTDSTGNNPFINFQSNTNKITNNFMREGFTNIGANDINGMLNDSDLIVLQQNYAYILWSLIAVGVVIIVVFYIKKYKVK